MLDSFLSKMFQLILLDTLRTNLKRFPPNHIIMETLKTEIQNFCFFLILNFLHWFARNPLLLLTVQVQIQK